MSSALASLLSIQCLAYELWLQYQDWKVAVGEGSGTIMFAASEPFSGFRTPNPHEVPTPEAWAWE